MASDGALRAVPRAEVDRAAWDAFVDGADEAWLWHRYDLQDALATWPGRRDGSLAVLDRAGELVGVVPLQVVEYRLKRILPRRRIESVGGPALANRLSRRERARVHEVVVARLLAMAAGQAAREISVTLTAAAPSFRGQRCPRVNPLLALGMENTLSQTWVVDLRRGREALWAGLKGRARTAVRKAQKSGVTVRRADGAGDLDTYYGLHRENYARTGARPHPKAYFAAIWAHFVSRGLARILFAEHGGNVIAAANFGVFKEAAVYWSGASDGLGLELGANVLLQWSAMKDLAAEGLSWVETGEAFPGAPDGKERRLSEFKESFGGELYPIYRGRLGTAGRRHAAGRLQAALQHTRTATR